ncbi:MAG TPA: SRPBCC family protein [Rhizomicrobium sp.]|jgi:uncharacterized protein YndB with AHSA1/START domain|nr:SRPBCC family protein [Rhizomicrobium sp.]
MANSSFVYVTYIKTTPEELWKALTTPEFTRRYWYGVTTESEWKPGSAWKMVFEDGRVADTGEIVESDPPRRMVIKWRNEFRPELKEEGYSRCVIEIEKMEDVAKLSISHSIPKDNSKFIEAVSGGWPMILSNLKSLLETGDVMVAKKA